MKNLKKVAKRIRDAVENNENIVLYADADLDGVTSAIILEETIEEIGGTVKLYISNREKWGYGMSREAVCYMKNESPALLISLDCGVSNFEGAKEAKRLGFEFVIIDHHKTLSKTPEASLVLDPLQKGDKYPFKQLANAGIVYKLAQEILKKDFTKKRERFLQLTTLATIADMVPREKDNKEILEEGLVLLENPSIVSLAVLKKNITGNFVERAVSLLNITKPVKTVNRAYLFFMEKREKRAEKLFWKIEEDHGKRKERIKKEEERILKTITGEESVIFREGNFSSSLAGTLASRIVRVHKKPTFLYAREGDVIRGSVRVVTGQDAVDAMDHCKKNLVSFGGHPMAAGFLAKAEDAENFKNCLINYFQKEG